jgi:tRNA threonylcarbamoyladenosine biosynthesis protein TsaB
VVVRHLLTIDTTGPEAVIGLHVNGHVAGEERFRTVRHAQGLLAGVRRLLDRDGLRLENIEVFAVNIGPGSFTGIRVALATVKAVCYALGSRLIGIDQFDAYAAAAPVERFHVVTRGQMATANAVLFERQDGNLVRRPVSTWPAAELSERLETDVRIIGPADVRPIVPTDRWLEVTPRLAEVALGRAADGKFDDPFRLEPNYVRPSSAEEKWDQRSG